MKSKVTKEPVVVTTEHRGVFFGYTDDYSGSTIELDRARMCIYWSRDIRGFMGLASQGPSPGCKIGPAADLIVHKVTSVVRNLSKEAVERWESAPWA